MTLAPLILYTHPGPNPFKVAIVLEELGLPYKFQQVPSAELKQPKFEAINPNGRVPAIYDPNTEITVWESAAIIEYLVDRYDGDHQLTITTSPEKYHVRQWLYFQMSGQGPYFGQAAWFNAFHSEKLPSAMKRYQNETRRVIGVLERHLQDREYLVGNKCTIADLSFLSWNRMLPLCLGGEMPDMAHEYPNFNRWNSKLMQRPAVAKIMAQMVDPRTVAQKRMAEEKVKPEEKAE